MTHAHAKRLVACPRSVPTGHRAGRREHARASSNPKDRKENPARGVTPLMIRRGHSHIYSNAGDEGTRVWGPTPDRAHGGTMDYSFANRAVAHPAPAVVSRGMRRGPPATRRAA